MNNILTPETNVLKQSKNTQISFYKTLYAKTNTPVSIGEILEKIKTGGEHKKVINQLRQEDNKEQRNKLKNKLPSVTISGLFENGHKEENIKEHSGFIQIDFDNVENIGDANSKLKEDKFSYSVFLSPSGNGLKVIVKIQPECKTHLSSFLQLQDYYKNKYSLKADIQCKDVSRLMFLSYDVDLYVNDKSDVWQTIEKNETNVFDRILETLERKESFIDGKRNSFVYKLACDCCKSNIPLLEAVNKCVSRYSTDNFNASEIETTVRSAYNTKAIEPKGQETKSYSIFKRVEDYLSERYVIRFNEVSTKIEFKNKDENSPFRVLNENNIYRELQLANINFSQAKISALFNSDFVESYNPFFHYFTGLSIWDENREPDYIDKLCDYIPTKDSTRFRLHFKKMLVRCIACALENNVFNKQVFVFVGEGQNTGKSTFCRWLCPPDLCDYITEYVNTDKDGLIVLATNFFINMDELATLSKAEINSLKSFISKDKINIRLPFDRRASTHPRRANFIGSTNNDEFLTDETGSVRWLCFEISGKLNFDYKNDIEIDNIWKEAFTLYKNGFEYQLTPSEIKENEVANSKFYTSTDEINFINKYFEPSTQEDKGEFLTSTDIGDDIASRHHQFKSNPKVIGKALKALGYERVTKYAAKEAKYTIWGYYVNKINRFN